MAAVTLNPGVIDTDMLRSCLPEHADSCVSPEEWAMKAVPLILGLGGQENGMALTVT
jgi:hypothetical protein